MKFGDGYNPTNIKEERENARYAEMARQADEKLAGQETKSFTPNVSLIESEAGSSKIGILKGKDLERLRAQLAKRKF